MADPLSITTGVLALLEVTWTVATELKKFRDEVSIVKESIGGLQRDVDGLCRVLEAMRDTFANITAEHGTGLLASHWSNVARSIVDGQSILLQLQNEVQRIDKTTTFLDGARKQLRLNLAEDRISDFRIHIQACRDALQLSLQTIILANQMSQQKSTELLVPNLNNLQMDIRHLAMDFNQKIDSLRSMVSSQQDQVKLTAMSNLQNCIRSSASLVSSASSAIASQRGGSRPKAQQWPTVAGSDFADCFPTDGIAMTRWMNSNTVYEYETTTSIVPPQSVADVPVIGDSDPGSGAGSDSDSDFESDILLALLESGKWKMATGDFKPAEKLLRNCLSRASSARSRRTRKQTALYLEIVSLLIQLYMDQKRPREAQEMLTLKMVAKERLVGNKDVDFLNDVDLLARLAQDAGDVVGSQLHARRALKVLRRAGDETIPQQRACLFLLIELCRADNSTDDLEAFEFMLATLGTEPIAASSDSCIAPTCPNGPAQSGASQAREAVLLTSLESCFDHNVRLTELAPADVSRLGSIARPDRQVDNACTLLQHEAAVDWSGAATTPTDLPSPGDDSPIARDANKPATSVQIALTRRASSRLRCQAATAVPALPVYLPVQASRQPQDAHDGSSAAKPCQKLRPNDAIASNMSAVSKLVVAKGPETGRSQSLSTQSSNLSRALSTTLSADSSIALSRGSSTTSSPDSSVASTELTAPSSTPELGGHASRLSKHLKIVVVGAKACGKSYLLRVLTEGKFPSTCWNTDFETFRACVEVDGISTELELRDTQGHKDYAGLRPLSYRGVHAVLLCFSIDDPDSLDLVLDPFISEVSRSCPGKPIVLVGLQSDLRYDAKTVKELRETDQHPVTFEEARDVQVEIGAKTYMECSAKLNEGVSEVFEVAARYALQGKCKQREEKAC